MLVFRLRGVFEELDAWELNDEIALDGIRAKLVQYQRQVLVIANWLYLT